MPAHLPRGAGEQIFNAIDRHVRVSFVKETLAGIALNERRYDDADREVGALAPSPARSELEGRIAAARGDRSKAIRYFLAASDLTAIGSEVDRLEASGSYRAAYDLENSLREGLLRTETHPDAVAESYWRSGELAAAIASTSGPKVRWLRVALAYLTKAHALAPFSEKYLLAAGIQALALGENGLARTFFQQCIDLNPESADAYSGLGLVLVRDGRFDQARLLLERSRAIDPQSKLILKLQQELQ